MEFYRLKMLNHSVAFSIKVNDITIFTNNHHELPSKEFNINRWLIAGKNNTATVTLSINPQWCEELYDHYCTVSIIRYSGDGEQFAPLELNSAEWKYEKDVTQFPVVLNLPFEVTDPHFEAPAWKQGLELSEETPDKISLFDFIGKLHDAMARKDVLSLLPILATKTRELCRSQYLSIDESLREQESFFRDELFSHPEWAMRPLNLKDVLIRYHDSGKLIEVTDKHGGMLVKSFPMDGDSFGIELWLSCINYQWILCR